MSGAKLVPELMVSSHAASRDFYLRVIGFKVRYERPAEKFSYLDLGGAELMQDPDGYLLRSSKIPGPTPSLRPGGSLDNLRPHAMAPILT